MTLKLILLALYVITIIIFGISAMKKTKSFSDFFLGGGNIGPWASAFTYGTAYFSAVLFIGFAGKIGWAFGLSGMWIGLGNALIGVLFVWWFLGPRIKQMSINYNVSTMAEFLELRYNSPFLKLFSAICIFIFFIPYSSAVFMGLSYLFESNFNTSYWMALIFMGGFTALYMTMGGYKAMTLVDIFFGIIMILGVLLLVYFTLNKVGGYQEIVFNLSKIDPRLAKAIGPPGFMPLFSLFFLTGVAPFAMPQLIQKFYAIKDDRSIKIGMFASTCFALLIGVTVYFIGATTRIILNPSIAPKAFSENGKPIVDILMPELLRVVLPDSLSIILLLVILSASMSTLAALVLISSSSLVKDIYHGFINSDAEDKKLTFLMRVMSVVFVCFSVVLAWIKPDTIVSILGVSWGAIGSVFIGPFIWGLLSKWPNKYGAIASSVIGLSICLGLYIGGYSSPVAGTIGMIASLIINPIISLLSIKLISIKH